MKWTKICVVFSALVFGCPLIFGCSTIPKVKHDKFKFPIEKAFIGDARKPYESLGLVRSKVNFQSADPFNEDVDYCRNYYNKAVNDLVKFARDKGGDAVIDVKSIVFFEDGRQKAYKTPECSDDGEEGQILTQGIAIKWKRDPDT